MILGIFPLIYIKLNKQNYIKLGFSKKKMLFFIFLGIIFGIFLFFADIFSEFLFLPLIEEFSPEPVHIAQEQELLLNMELILKIFFSFVVVIDQILEEILFRGVIQNSFSKYFNEKHTSKNTIIPKFQSVLTTIGIELAFYLIFTVNPYFLFINLIPSVVISIYFELTKKNMTGLIFLKATFTIIGLISFFLL
jgi:hypothetical protein